jgi:hypothetical protein
VAPTLFAMLLASCGGDGDNSEPVTPPGPTPTQETPGAYLQSLPTWEEYSPPVAPEPPTKVGDSVQTQETIDNVAVVDPVSQAVIGYRSEQYNCTSTKFDMATTPEKLVMFSPDREVLWPGSLIQGKSHRDGLGSLLPLTIAQRASIKVSIPSLATEDNYRVVETPDQAEVNQAIGSMIFNATTSNLVTPSTIQFVMEDYNSEESFALKSSLSGRYLGFSASASASVSRQANERTVMVYFYEKMFEAVVEPPQTPGSFFNSDFTMDRLNEQIALGRMGPDNPPIYVSNVVYGRMMAFTFTSTATASEIKAALNAAYKGIFSASFSLSAEHKKILEEGKITVTSLGGQSKATVALIASGNWRDYFTEVAPLTSAYPISYTFRNLGDGSIAKVAEATDYEVKECALADTAFSGFVLDSFETQNEFNSWTAISPPVSLAWGAPETPQSIFYGYVHAKHTNTLSDTNFLYDVGYLIAPDHFKGDKSDFYKGELTFWYRPDETIYSQNTGTYCSWVYWLGIPIFYYCSDTVVQTQQALDSKYQVLAYDDVTTFDQVVLRGGVEPNAILTLTYNPKQSSVGMGWGRHELSLTNDSTVNSQCDASDPEKRGCWLTEDQIATEEQIKYVLANVTDFRIRASYPVQRKLCADVGADPEAVLGCTDVTFVPFGYVGGYFDEVMLNKKSAGL